MRLDGLAQACLLTLTHQKGANGVIHETDFSLDQAPGIHRPTRASNTLDENFPLAALPQIGPPAITDNLPVRGKSRIVAHSRQTLWFAIYQKGISTPIDRKSDIRPENHTLACQITHQQVVYAKLKRFIQRQPVGGLGTLEMDLRALLTQQQPGHILICQQNVQSGAFGPNLFQRTLLTQPEALLISPHARFFIVMPN